MKIKVETKKQIILKCKSVFVWADFITPILCSENGRFLDMDYYQIIRHKKEKRSNRFSFYI